MGTQALVILVSHLASPQYVLLLLGATESVCEGKQCYKAREGNAEAFSVWFQPPQQHNTEMSVVISRTSTRVVEGFGEGIVWLSGSQRLCCCVLLLLPPRARLPAQHTRQ